MPKECKMDNLEYHPISMHFPLLNNEELKEMADDIRESGLQNAISIYEGKILDGRNRYLACKMAGVTPFFRNYAGNDPLGLVFSQNIQRRNLDVSQRGALATKFANMRRGERTDITPNKLRVSRPEVYNGMSEGDKSISIQEAADLAGVSRSTVVRAKKILEKAPDKFEDIVNGKRTIGETLREIKQESTPPTKRVSSPDIQLPVTIDKGRVRAMTHAQNAINELRSIPLAEKSRTEAYKSVRSYINHSLKS